MIFDQSREQEITPYGEAVRLANEIRPKTYIDDKGNRIDRKGINIETSTINEIKGWLNDSTIKKSQSSIMFVHRFFAMKFPDEYARLRDVIDSRFQREFERVQSEARQEAEWLGEVGFQNMVRLDGSLTKNNIRVSKKRDGSFKFTFK